MIHSIACKIIIVGSNLFMTKKSICRWSSMSTLSSPEAFQVSRFRLQGRMARTDEPSQHLICGPLKTLFDSQVGDNILDTETKLLKALYLSIGQSFEYGQRRLPKTLQISMGSQRHFKITPVLTAGFHKCRTI